MTTINRKLHLVLIHHYYDRILAGNKTVEYRIMSPYWQRVLWNPRKVLHKAVFHRGYTATTITCDIILIDIGPCPLYGWNDRYYRIHFRPTTKKINPNSVQT